jgi:hypothetical protein
MALGELICGHVSIGPTAVLVLPAVLPMAEAG